MTDEGLQGRLYQINWAELSSPCPQTTLCSIKGDLFYRATLRDCTSQMEVWVREKAALNLSGLGMKELFQETVAEGGAVHAFIVSVRIVVRASKENGKALFVVVEGQPQNL